MMLSTGNNSENELPEPGLLLTEKKNIFQNFVIMLIYYGWVELLCTTWNIHCWFIKIV